MKSIFEAITEFFEADNWPIHQIENKPAYSVTFEGNSGRWTCIAQAIESERQFIFYSTCPVNVSEAFRASVAEFISEVNYNLIMGNFELNLGDGDLRYRTSISLPGHELGAFLIHQLVYTNVTTMDKYLPVILKVMNGQFSPQEALKII